MIVELSWAELQACRQWGSERHRELLSTGRARTSKGRHEVSMPAIGWRTLADRLVAQAFHAGNGRHRKTHTQRAGAPATRQAASKIERSLAELVMHPARRGEAQAGVHGNVFMFWRQQASRQWSPYPVPGVAPTFLVPTYQKARGIGDVTVWQPQDEPPGNVEGLFPDPASHEGFD